MPLSIPYNTIAGKLKSDATSADSGKDTESLFDAVNSKDALQVFRELIGSDTIKDVNRLALNLIQLLQLGKIEQGFVSPAAKYKSLTARWFGTKKESKKGMNEPDENYDNEVFIERDTLVTIEVTHGKQESTQSYQVLSIFSKHYNK